MGVQCSHINSTAVCPPCSEFLAIPRDIDNLVKSLAQTDDEVQSLIDAVKCIEPALQRYAAHKVRSLHQAKQITVEAEKIKLNKSKTMLVIDHKKKVLPQRYREGQQEFFGKREMLLLGVAKFYLGDTHFSDYAIDGYSTQDNVQVFAAITLIREQIAVRYPDMEEIVLQSDNASCFASHEHVRNIHVLNKKARPKITKWIYTESGAGKTSLDCHFLYANLQFEAYLQDGNIMGCEPNVFQALKYNDGILHSSAYLLNMRNIDSSGLPKEAFKAKKFSDRETHDVAWLPDEGSVHLRRFSGFPIVESIRGVKLDQFENPKLGVFMEMEHHSPKRSRPAVPTGKRKSTFQSTHQVLLQAMTASIIYRPVSPQKETFPDDFSQCITHDSFRASSLDTWAFIWARKSTNRIVPIPRLACQMFLKWYLESKKIKDFDGLPKRRRGCCGLIHCCVNGMD